MPTAIAREMTHRDDHHARRRIRSVWLRLLFLYGLSRQFTSVTTYAAAAGASARITHSSTYDIAGNVMTAEVDCCHLNPSPTQAQAPARYTIIHK